MESLRTQRPEREARVGEKLRPTMELSQILAVSDKTQSVNLKEIEVSDYYLCHIRVIPEIQRAF